MDRIENEPEPGKKVVAKPDNWTDEQWQAGMELCLFIRRFRAKRALKARAKGGMA